MPKASKTNRQMFDAFASKYEDVPAVFIARTLDYLENYGNCFDAILDYKPIAIQEFNTERNKWQNKKL